MTKPKTHTETGKVRYRALTGLNYRDKRVEAGAIVEDLPKDSIGWLKEQGLIVQIKEELAGNVPTPATEQVEPEEETE